MKKILAIITLALTTSASAQTLLGGAEFSTKLPKNFSVGAELEFRSTDWFADASQWSAEASLGYKPVKPLKISAAYKFIQQHNPAGETNGKKKAYPAYWDAKHRVSISATASLKIQKFELSLRERYQYTYRPSHLIPFLDPEDGNRTINAKSYHILRSRLQAEFKPRKKSPWKPYVSFELYTRLKTLNHTEATTESARFYDKWRIAAGTSYKINKHNALELFYRYTRSSDADENDAPHTIALVYSFSL